MRIVTAIAALFLSLPLAGVESEIRREALDDCMRDCIARLRGLVAASERGYVVEPVRMTFTDFLEGDTKEVTRRYRLERREMPRYEYEYEEVEVMALIKEPGATDGVWKKVKRTQVKDRKQVGTEVVEIKVYDENGPFEEVIEEQDWEEITYTLHVTPHHFLATNAAALVAMRRTGVPHDDPVAKSLVVALQNLITHTDLPDTTLDLAWYAYAMLHERSPEHDPHLRAALAKLLAGQAGEGSCAGMWGPVCIDRETLARAIKVDLLIDRAWREMQEQASGRRHDRAFHERYARATDARSIHRHRMRALSRQGLRYAQYDTPLMTDPGLADDHQMSFPGLPYDIYHVQLTDLETTALVLEVLALASARDLLPEELPAVTLPNGQPVRRAEPVVKRLRRCLAALTRLQANDGSFDAGNRAASVTIFDRLGIEQLPEPPPPIAHFPSASGSRYTVAGARALLALERLLLDDRPSQRDRESVLEKISVALSDIDLAAERSGSMPPPTGALGHDRFGRDRVEDLWLDRAWPALPLMAGQLGHSADGRQVTDLSLIRSLRLELLEHISGDRWGVGSYALPSSALRSWYIALGPEVAMAGPQQPLAYQIGEQPGPPRSQEELLRLWAWRYPDYLTAAYWRFEDERRRRDVQMDARLWETALATSALADAARTPLLASDDPAVLAEAMAAMPSLDVAGRCPGSVWDVTEDVTADFGTCRLVAAGKAIALERLLPVARGGGLVLDLAERDLEAVVSALGADHRIEAVDGSSIGLAPGSRPAIVDTDDRPVWVAIAPTRISRDVPALLAHQVTEGLFAPAWSPRPQSVPPAEQPGRDGGDPLPADEVDEQDSVEIDGETITIDDLIGD